MPYRFIYSEDEVRKFFSILSPLKPDEAYFVSLSARNKYLTDEERKAIDLGRTEMFARKLVKQYTYEAFIRTLRTYEINDGGFTSRSNIPLPEKCIVIYANINPVSGKAALKEFYEKTTQLLFDLSDDNDSHKRLASLDTELMNCYQRARGTKKFIDIDCDVPDDGVDIVELVLNEFKANSVDYHVIKTRGGFHILIDRSTLHYNYTTIINKANELAVERFGHAEVVVNKNEMVPICGCISAGFPVHFVNL